MTDVQTDPAPADIIVALGNRDGIEMIPDPADSEEAAAADGRAIRKVARPIGQTGDKRCTTVVIPGSSGLIAALTDITAATGIWANHSAADAPAWVASTNPRLAEVLAEHYRCEVREYDPDHQPDTATPAAPVVADTEHPEG